MEPSAEFNPDVVIHGMAQSLLAAQVFFRRLHGYMTEQKLYLFKLPSSLPSGEATVAIYWVTATD